MDIPFYKYQGAGNDFVIIDHRNMQLISHSDIDGIATICDRRFGIGADGLILIEESDVADFKMIYFNADGRQSSMCGNGGRCITALASRLDIFSGNECSFEAIDGLHKAVIVEEQIVSLQMTDVPDIENSEDNYVLNTGSPHFIQFVPDVEAVDVVEKGRSIRESEQFGPDGINVNFVEVRDQLLKIRTYERGVEDETLACGTGVTAAALVWDKMKNNHQTGSVKLLARGGELQVEFTKNENGYSNVWLTGPARFVYNGVYSF